MAKPDLNFLMTDLIAPSCHSRGKKNFSDSKRNTLVITDISFNYFYLTINI